MAGKPTMRTAGANYSDTQSIHSMNSVRTVDREKLRDKARQFQMKENLRMELCMRLQHQLKKQPKAAEELAGQVMRVLQMRGISAAELSNDALAAIERELSAQRREQMETARQMQNADLQLPVDSSTQKVSGTRSSGSKDRLSRSGGGSDHRQKAGGMKPRANSNTSGSNKTSITTRDDDNTNDIYLTQTQLQQLSTGFQLPPRVSPKKDKDNGIWEEIAKFSSIEEQLEAKRKKEQKILQRADFTSKLEQQVKQKHQQTQQEHEANERFHQESIRHQQELEEEERHQEQQRMERAKQLSQIQTEQRLAKIQKLERERQLKKAQEFKMAQQLQEQKENELAREQAKRQAEKRQQELVFIENAAQLEQKHQAKARERAYELKLAEDYIQMEQAKDAARKKQLEDMANNIKAKMKFFGDTAKAEMDAKAQEEERRVFKYQQEYAKQQEEAERQKKNEADARTRAQQESLKQQVLEKKQREESLKHDLNKQAELWRQERLEAERQEKISTIQRNLRNKNQQDLLRQQIRDKEHRSLLADQTQLEVQLNMGLLNKIHIQTGTAQLNGANVVSETQNRSRELQEQEQSFLQHRAPPRSTKF